MRRNNGIVTEKAHLNSDQKKYEEGWDRIFGPKPKKKEETCGTCESPCNEDHCVTKTEKEEEVGQQSNQAETTTSKRTGSKKDNKRSQSRAKGEGSSDKETPKRD